MTEVLHIQQYWQLEDLYNEQEEPSGDFQRVLCCVELGTNDAGESRKRVFDIICYYEFV